MKKIMMLAAASAALFSAFALDGARDADARYINPPAQMIPFPEMESQTYMGLIWHAAMDCETAECVRAIDAADPMDLEWFVNMTQKASTTYKRTCETHTYSTGSETMCAYPNGDGYWISTETYNGQTITEIGRVTTNPDGSKTITYSMVDGTIT